MRRTTRKTDDLQRARDYQAVPRPGHRPALPALGRGGADRGEPLLQRVHEAAPRAPAHDVPKLQPTAGATPDGRPDRDHGRHAIRPPRELPGTRVAAQSRGHERTTTPVVMGNERLDRNAAPPTAGASIRHAATRRKLTLGGECFPSWPCSVPDSVRRVLERGSPLEVLEPVVGGVPVQVPRLKALLTQTDERLEHEVVDSPVYHHARYAECNPWIPIFIKPLAHDPRLIMPLSNCSPLLAPGPDASEGTYVVEVAADDRPPGFHGAPVVPRYGALGQSMTVSRRGRHTLYRVGGVALPRERKAN